MSSLLYYKARRNEKPKDTNDVELIMNYQANYEPKKLFMWNFKKRISIFISIKIIILELLRKIYRNIIR